MLNVWYIVYILSLWYLNVGKYSHTSSIWVCTNPYKSKDEDLPSSTSSRVEDPLQSVLTPPKFNIEPENHPLEKENTSSKSSFLGAVLVFREGKFCCYSRKHQIKRLNIIFPRLRQKFQFLGDLVMVQINMFIHPTHIFACHPPTPSLPQRAVKGPILNGLWRKVIQISSVQNPSGIPLYWLVYDGWILILANII